MTKRMLELNGLAILGVILHHTAGWGLIAMFLWTNQYRPVTVPNYDMMNTAPYYLIRVVDQLVMFAIPAFLFISGYFIAFATPTKSRTIGWKAILSRLKYLLIPYLIWSIIFIILDMVEGKVFSLQEYVVYFLTGGVRGPYYFISVLAQLYILAPLIVPLARSHWKLLLFIAAIIQFLSKTVQYLSFLNINAPLVSGHFLPNWFFTVHCFWFVLGMVVGFHLKSFKPWLTRVRWIALGATILLFVVGFAEREIIFRSVNQLITPVETPLDSLYGLSFILAFLAFGDIVSPLSRYISYLGSNSFGIFLVHVPAQEYFARIIYNFAPFLLGVPFLYLPLLFIVGLFIPIFLMEGVKKLPNQSFYRYIFG